MLDLNTLKAVLEPLSQVGKDERTFNVGDHTVTLKPLLPHEEVAVQRYASEFLEERAKTGNKAEDEGMDRAEALDYFDRFRIEVISHAICEIDGHPIRDDYVATGETTDSGKPVRIPRGQAMRDLIRQSWSRTMITSTFSQYGELVEALALEADEIAGKSVADLDVEIERTTDRLQQLKNDRTEKTKGDPGITNKEMETLVQAGAEVDKETKEVASRSEKIRKRRIRAERNASEAFGIKEDAIPEAFPTRKEEPEPEVEEPASKAVEDPASKAVEPQVSFEDIQSSFQDGEDPEVLAREQARILDARRKAQLAQREHLSKDASSGLGQPAGKVDGVEAYRLPPTELSPRGRTAEPSSGKIGLDSKPQGEKNPNFKGK